MRGWRLWIAAVTVMVAWGATGTEAAIIFPFSGSGSSGNASPAPLTWEVVSLDAEHVAWTLVGPWPSETLGTDFHITFEGRTILESYQLDENTVAVTNFHLGSGIFWNQTINGSTVEFFAFEGGELTNGSPFSIGVILVGGAPAIESFTAHWTTVPEPASLTLIGAGLITLYAIRRRR